MSWYDVLFWVSLLLGLSLVLCSALGLAGLDADAELGSDAPEAEPDEGALGLLGVGRVPLAIALMLLLLLFGGTGLIVSPPAVSAYGALLGGALATCLATLVSLVGGTWLARKIARHLPSVESYASHKTELAACGGSIVLLLSQREAIARVIDRGGAELRVRCLVQGESAQVGDRIVVLAYEAAADRYVVERISFS